MFIRSDSDPCIVPIHTNECKYAHTNARTHTQTHIVGLRQSFSRQLGAGNVHTQTQTHTQFSPSTTLNTLLNWSVLVSSGHFHPCTTVGSNDGTTRQYPDRPPLPSDPVNMVSPYYPSPLSHNPEPIQNGLLFQSKDST